MVRPDKGNGPTEIEIGKPALEKLFTEIGTEIATISKSVARREV